MTHMKETIETVAVDLFFKKGYFATSISEIAKGCGIQKASIYHHFAGKEALLYRIMEVTMIDLMTELNQNMVNATDVEDRMRAAVRSHVAFHLSRQKETFIASSELRGLSEKNFSRIVNLRDAYERQFQEIIDAGIAQGLFEPYDVRVLSYAILTICTGGATWYRPDGRLSVEDIVSIYEHFIINGLRKGSFSTSRPAELVCDGWPI